MEVTAADPAQNELSDGELLEMALDLEQSIVQQSVCVSSSTTNMVQNGGAFDMSVPGVANMPWPSFTFNNCTVTVNLSK